MPSRWGRSKPKEETRKMKKLIVTSLLAIGLATPALAAEKYFVTVDTVGMCSVILDMPGTELSAGKTSIGAAEGYETMEDAKTALAEIKDEKCEGIVVG
jgi:pyridoxal biosynthesis lyase PdxS